MLKYKRHASIMQDKFRVIDFDNNYPFRSRRIMQLEPVVMHGLEEILWYIFKSVSLPKNYFLISERDIFQ